MRTLKYAILGLINRKPMTGYDITKEFNSNALANFWYAKHSQVYPELNRLLEENLLTCEVVIQGEKMEKKLYSITQKGHDELITWLMADEVIPATPKDVFRLRMYFSDFMTQDEIIWHLKNQKRKHLAKRQYLINIMEKNFQNIAPPLGTPEGGDFMVLEGAILRETSYLEWLNNCLKRA